VQSADPPLPSAGGLAGRNRLGVVGGVLLAEYLLISLRFDALGVADRGGIWTFVGRVGAVAPVAVVIATAVLLFRRGTSPPIDLTPARRSPLFLAAHVALYAGLYAVTARVFGTEEAPSGSAVAWLALFALLTLGCGLSLLVGLVGTGVLVRAISWSALVAIGIGVLAWTAGLLATELWVALSELTLSVSAHIVRAFAADVRVDAPNLILGLAGFEVHVSRECSGLEGVGLIGVLLVAYLVAFREQLKMPRALLLLPLGLLLVWLGNALRIAILMVVGAYFDAELAYGGFHSKLGWILFCAIALGMAAVAQRSRYFRAAPEGEQGAEFENPTAAFLVPALALVATALVTAMFARDLDRYYWVRLVAAGAALVAYRSYYRELPRAWSPLAIVAGLAIGVVWVATDPRGGDGGELDVHWGWLVARSVGSVVAAPIVEELAFRGCLLRWFISRDFTSVPWTRWTPLAVGASSLAFGLLHERWVAATLVGVLLAGLQCRKGHIMDAVLAHAAANAVVTGWVLWTGNPALWS
jgi:exosortase E/protease (VPEID-CTERM system)